MYYQVHYLIIVLFNEEQKFFKYRYLHSHLYFFKGKKETNIPNWEGREVEDASTRNPNLSSNFEISFSFTARNISQGYFHFVPLASSPLKSFETDWLKKKNQTCFWVN